MPPTPGREQLEKIFEDGSTELLLSYTTGSGMASGGEAEHTSPGVGVWRT